MSRRIVVILAMLLCSMATQLYALGLGTVTVESSLNQPLQARIELLQLGATPLQDIRVQIASNADFQRFNIERTAFLSNIRFSVESTPQGNAVVLTTPQIVREPYLSFILDTRWPNGRLLSEHTILLDLPVFDEQGSAQEIRQPISPVLQQASPVQITTQAFVETPATPGSTSSAVDLQPAATAGIEAEVKPGETPVKISAEPEIAPEVQTIEPRSDAGTTNAAEPEQAETQTIETDTGDTLSDIAVQVRPDSSVSMQQIMLAIQQLNPGAFTDGNINRLRSGRVLRVPTLEQMKVIDARDAVDEVTRQNQGFVVASIQPLAAPADTVPAQDDEPQGQLSVVVAAVARAIEVTAGSADSGSVESASVENEALDQRIAELETQLAQRQEEADRARIEREERDSRMQDLEMQIAAAQEIIRLQDIQLAQLQRSLAAAAEAQLLAEQQAIQDTAEADVSQPIVSPPGLFDELLRILTSNNLFMIFGVIVVVLLLVVLMLRRNRATNLSAEGDVDAIDQQELENGRDDTASEYAQQDESDRAAEEASRESDTKPFLDDLAIDLDSFDDENEQSEDAFESSGGGNSITEIPEPGAEPSEGKESDDTDFSFDLADDDEVAAKNRMSEENQEELETSDLDLDDAVGAKIEDAVDNDLEFLPDDELETGSVDDAEEVELLSDHDETATKLELAYAYKNMGDTEGAKEILQEVIKEGSEGQIEEANRLLGTLDDNTE